MSSLASEGTYSVPYSDGYQCGNCGSWVMPGVGHACCKLYPSNPQPVYPPTTTQIISTITPVQLEELNQKLDTLTEAVKELIKELQNKN